MAEPPTPQRTLAGLRILLVEDDPLICLDLETSLQDLGATVRSALTLEAALTSFEAEQPDVAILDFELNGRTSGPLAGRAQQHGVPFLFLSGYGETDGHFARWPGVTILVKPIAITTLAAAIERLFGRESTV